jgi:hypothetical protein
MTLTVITGTGGFLGASGGALNLTGFARRIPYDKAALELGYRPVVDYATGLRHVSAWWRETRLKDQP